MVEIKVPVVINVAYVCVTTDPNCLILLLILVKDLLFDVNDCETEDNDKGFLVLVLLAVKLFDANTLVLKFLILSDLLRSKLVVLFIIINEERKYEVNGEYFEVSFLCIILEYFDSVSAKEVKIVIDEKPNNEEVVPLAPTDADDFILLLIFPLDQ